MNREIKFRAWDKETNEFNYVYLKNKSVDFSHYVSNKNWEEFQEYTGLKDNRNKEIYEGDIITFTEIDEDSAFGIEETHTVVVTWIEEIAQWRAVYNNGQRRELHLITDFSPVYKCEIIGNIYENENLINNKKIC